MTFGARYSEVEFEGVKLRVKHFTVKQYAEFREKAGVDNVAAVEWLLRLSLEVDSLDDMPVSLRAPYLDLVMQANGFDVGAVKNSPAPNGEGS